MEYIINVEREKGTAKVHANVKPDCAGTNLWNINRRFKHISTTQYLSLSMQDLMFVVDIDTSKNGHTLV